ncbi:MAG TPA: PhoU domain-containing protein [Phycisphaerales bacterium]|nr:PhoU domain-containing protein [Phycisphaerales bacterium]
MPSTPQGFATRLARLKADLVDQGRRVQELVERAFDAVFDGQGDGEAQVLAQDEVIDRVDVEMEKASVQLLADATRQNAALEPAQLRRVLTIVKVNNELERIADAGVAIASHAAQLKAAGPLPGTLRVMANSVIGIIRDANAALDGDDPELAKIVLASEDAVLEFKRALVRDAHQRLCRGEASVDLAFSLAEIAGACDDMADHCTNIAEQIIYQATGAVVRHMPGHWEEFTPRG